MKKISLIIFLIILNFGCEKVVEIDLEFNEKRYVIDAKIINTQTLIKGSAPVAKIAGIPAYNNKLDILFNHAVFVIIFCLLIRGG